MNPQRKSRSSPAPSTGLSRPVQGGLTVAAFVLIPLLAVGGSDSFRAALDFTHRSSVPGVPDRFRGVGPARHRPAAALHPPPPPRPGHPPSHRDRLARLPAAARHREGVAGACGADRRPDPVRTRRHRDVRPDRLRLAGRLPHGGRRHDRRAAQRPRGQHPHGGPLAAAAHAGLPGLVLRPRARPVHRPPRRDRGSTTMYCLALAGVAAAVVATAAAPPGAAAHRQQDPVADRLGSDEPRRPDEEPRRDPTASPLPGATA